jgi:hypothetical protein
MIKISRQLYHGCGFINTVSELGDILPDVCDISSRHKQDITNVIADLLPDPPNRLAIANAAAIAVDGAIVKAQLDSNAKLAALQGLTMLLLALNESNMFH